jgi:DNA-binding NtrC family response regulator
VTGREETETQARSDAAWPTLRVRSATIEVLRGPDAGVTARIAQPTFIVGTGAEADLTLADPAVSRAHLRLSLAPSGVDVRDYGSKNGTWLGGVRIERATLAADATITVGATALLVCLDSLDLPVVEGESFGGAIGRSVAMRHLFAILARAAQTESTVLLEGETGVGKEVLARAIHETSPRRDQPFVAVDCGAIPAGLIESELFGHERGAFTGASQRRDGVFQQAQGGTLFLDEIGELPLDLQPKLLRALEQREVRPVGGQAAHRVDVRIIAATNRRLAEATEGDSFRRDLYYRLAIVRVTVPSLRDRPDDIVPLATAFFRRLKRAPDAELPPDLAAMFTAYAWPGNVRELRNVVERYALLDVRDAGTLFDVAPRVGDASDLTHLHFREAREIAIDRFERDYTERVLERASGVVVRAAELAGVARGTFYRMLERVRVGRR